MYAQTTIIGYLGRDPETRYTPQGQAVTQFTVATSHKYIDKSGERVSITSWYHVAAWGKRGEVCKQYLKKGAKVFVAGRLVPDKTTGGPRIWKRDDGSAGASFEITAENVLFLSDRPHDEMNQDAGAATGEEFPGMDQTAEQEVPF